MKKTVLQLCLFLTCITSSFSQIPFPDNGAIWKESHLTIAGPITYHYALCRDTTRAISSLPGMRNCPV